MEDPLETMPQGVRDHRPIFRKDKHLSSALITTEIQYLLTHRKNSRALKREHRELIETLDQRNATIRASDQFIPWVADVWKEFAHTSEPITTLTTALKIATHALKVSLRDYIGVEYDLSVTPTRDICLLFHIKQNFTQVLEDITYSHEFHQSYKVGRYLGDAYGNLHLLWITPRECWLITHSHIVAIRDMFNSWFDVYLYSHIHRNKYPGYNYYDEVTTCIDNGRRLLKTHGQDAYLLLKMWPSLVISCILRDVEMRGEFFSTIKDDLDVYQYTPFYQVMTDRYTDDIKIQMRLEMTGLWKCFGHPDIKMDLSVANWIGKGTEGKSPEGGIENQMVWAFRLEFCRQFYKQKKRWPTTQMDERVPKKIRNSYQNNLWTEKPGCIWVPEDFAHVVLEKNLDFDYHVDLSDLLSDRSIIPGLDQWIHEYDKQAHRTQYGYFPQGPPATSKSVVVHYLQTPHITVKGVIDQISSGIIPENWRVMVAVAKEREFNGNKARFYGKMCFEMRLFQTVTEKGLADGVFPFVKHQSMTMSEEQLTRTILRMNTPIIQLEGETHVFIVLDFSSWCTNFRHELVTPLFQEIDRLFGLVNVYAFTHLFPLISTLLFQDRFDPPQQTPDGTPREGRRCYHGPEAWLEGLRQKGWTLATIMIILMASWKCGTSASLLGQGDNQVILLRIPPQAYLSARKLTLDTYVQEYLSVLKDLCNRAQIVVKIEETWYSRHLFEYSRKYHYKGIQVSGCLKRISRLASEANQVIPSLQSDLSGLFSTGAAAAGEDSTPMWAYFCTVVEACTKLWRSNPWLAFEPWEKTCCILLVTRCLGGYPITIYSQFCTRAVQDVLSTNLHLVKTVSQDPLLGPHIAQVVTLAKSRHRDFLALIKDPQSLPLDIPLQPDNYIRGEVKKGMEILVVNRDIRVLFGIDANLERQRLIEDLSRIRPCNPKLLNKLYTLSNVGLQEKWMGMFANTRSIQQTAFKSWSSEYEVIQIVRSLETKFSMYLKNKPLCKEVTELMSCLCVTTYTQTLRERMWEVPVEGITMPPQQEQTKLINWSEIPKEWTSRAILITEHPSPLR